MHSEDITRRYHAQLAGLGRHKLQLRVQDQALPLHCPAPCAGRDRRTGRRVGVSAMSCATGVSAYRCKAMYIEDTVLFAGTLICLTMGTLSGNGTGGSGD